MRAVFHERPSLCRELEVVDAEAELFTFNAGWLFADRGVQGGGVPALASEEAEVAVAARRRELDAAIRRSRVTQAGTRVLDGIAGRPGRPCEGQRIRVHPGQLLVPLAATVVVTALAVVGVAAGMPRLTTALAAAVRDEGGARRVAGGGWRRE
eukprot:TRINITY_DN1622_c0_g1_i11.p3 TRINITY_DN1622_c0_g1~~TRINITY_DN1622_c0_g1_i11.p3  ORF type:complete len:153 (-),score=42.20 TRINITY_DN1622_c0_g1_i11:85-543(-)